MAASTIQFASLGIEQTALSTELNALPNNGKAIGAAAIDNTVTRQTHCLVSLFAGFQGVPTANGNVNVYFCPSADGLNFDYGADPGSNIPSGALLAATFHPDVAAQKLFVARAELPGPCKYKVVVVNETVQLMTATGNTLKVTQFADEVV